MIYENILTASVHALKQIAPGKTTLTQKIVYAAFKHFYCFFKSKISEYVNSYAAFIAVTKNSSTVNKNSISIIRTKKEKSGYESP